MVKINPYINFNGNTEEAFNFYKSIFGGEFPMVMRYKDTPEAEKVQAADRDKIMHIALPIGKNNMLMGTDALESMGQKLKPGNNFHLTISTETDGEADKIYNGLSEGGQKYLPMHKTFWGAYFGMLTDKFGINWMVSHDENNPG